METALLLSKVLGTFVIICGIIVILRKEYFIPLISVFVKERLTRLVLSATELLAGLFLVFSHFDFSTPAAAIITIFGIMAVTESIMYFSMPDKTLQKFISTFNDPRIYVFGGVLSVAIGLYLISYGFGVI